MIVVGTSGYAYDDWKGPFYPPDLNPRGYLSFYARHFAFTEINSTYYRLPSPYMLKRLGEKTPGHFTFAVKAFSGITHERTDLETHAPAFVEALAPLESQGKLACVVLQFPHSFRPEPANEAYLQRVREFFGEVPLVVEFRHRSWVEQDRTFALLRELDAGFVCVDEPQLSTLVPPVVRATGPVGYVRFHGRNREKWWHHEQAYERYNYLYSDAELREWVPRLRELEAGTRQVFVAMNNHYQAKAVINARMLQQLLEMGAPPPGAGLPDGV